MKHMNWNLILYNLTGLLSMLELEDFILLALILLFAFEKKCDRNFLIVLAIVFITGLPKQMLPNLFSGRPLR